MVFVTDDQLLTSEQLLGVKKIIRIKAEQEITPEILKQCHNTAAYIVAHHGDVYLPIFERMEHELEKCQSAAALKEKAFKVIEESEW